MTIQPRVTKGALLDLIRESRRNLASMERHIRSKGPLDEKDDIVQAWLRHWAAQVDFDTSALRTLLREGLDKGRTT